MDHSVSYDRMRDRFGRSAWAFTSDAHAEIARAHGLPSKRAQQIEKAEQHKADALTEALRELDEADVGDAGEEDVDEKDVDDVKLEDIDESTKNR